MKSFSEREGHRPIRTDIQIESIDRDLKYRLWNALCEFYWKKYKPLRLTDDIDLNKYFPFSIVNSVRD